MIKDPDTAWNGTYPYDALEAAAIGPDSTRDEVKDASFTLMARGLMNSETQAALKELDDLPRRLMADALQYEVDMAEEIALARAALETERTAVEAPPEDEPPELPVTELLSGLADEAPEIRLAPPADPGQPQVEVISLAVVDDLIHFDR